MPLKKIIPFKRDLPISKIPPLYYFESKEAVQLAQIQGNAIVLIGGQDKFFAAQKIYRMQAYFVKDQQYNKNGRKELMQTVDFSAAHLQAILSGRDPLSGKVEVAIDEAMTDSLYGKIFELAAQQNFPYKRTQLYLSKDSRSIKLSWLNSDPAMPDANDNIHPLLQEHLQHQFDPDYKLLTLLYKLKQSPDLAQSIDLYQREGKALGGIRFNKHAHAVSIDEMIERVQQANSITFAAFQQAANHIEQRFNHSNQSLTKQKTDILHSFVKFYQANFTNPDFISRGALVAAWAEEYQKQEGTNPFDILKQQRCTAAFKKLFNPKTTTSIGLFNKFLAAEELPQSLQLMLEPQSLVEMQELGHGLRKA